MNAPRTSSPALPTTLPFLTDEARWEAVRTRDARADGKFYFGVQSTGIYCRPGCPARTPRRENLRFFASCAEAETAGFRPCRRCRPDKESLASTHADMITAACRRIDSAEVAPPLDELAAAAGMSRFHFHRLFKAMTGITPKAYATARRAKRLRDALQRSGNVTAAIYEAGYNGSTSFYADAPHVLGMTPARYRQRGAGMSIRFALGTCSLGAILVAATEIGLCAILLGDDGDQLLRELQDRFPRAQLIGADRAFEQWMASVIGFIDDPAIGLELPLDLRGTAFQQRVWQALRQVPAGDVVSYSDITARLGLPPRSVRAVAAAIAANPLAVAIPCHRVVRRDGDLAGYRWGIARKRELIAHEAEKRAGKHAEHG